MFHSGKPWQDPQASPQDRAEALLAHLTLREKLAQLGSFWDRPLDEEGEGDVAPLQHAFDQARRPFDQAIRHGLGQLTRVFGTAPVEPAEGAARLAEVQARVAGASRFGIPAIAHEECLTGVTAYRATVYPAPIAWGASFDDDLVREMAAAIGSDLAALGVHQGLAPLLDVVRDYRWGRVEESIGEDPYLVGMLGSAYVQGLQSAGIVATLKHFAGYPASKAGRNHAPVSVGPREFADVLLLPFEMAVRVGGARSVMNSYSDIDGLPAAASVELLTGVLRDRWGFTGTVVSDYWAIAFLDLMHRVTADRAASGAAALRAGLDVELPDADAFARLEGLVASGELEEGLVARAVCRVLAQKAELGLLDAGWRPGPRVPGEEIDLDPPRNRALARRLAEESIVLLSNDGTLPLDPIARRRIALIGPTADQARSFLGCYSFPNHVLVKSDPTDLGIDVPSLHAALKSALPGAEIGHEAGTGFLDGDDEGIARAVSAAAQADLVVLALGDIAALFGRGTSGEGCDAADLALPGRQAELAEAVLATGTPVVLVLVTGRPYALGGIAERCAAVVQAFLPGEEGGAAIAAVLSGDVNPSGRLPVGIPRTPGGQPHTYLAPPLGQDSEGISNLDPRPLHPFGHGLSYTSFAYERLTVDAERLATDGVVTVTVRVANTGRRDGVEVVQLYLSDEVAQVTRPVRALVGYARVPLAAGARAEVDFEVHADRTAFTGIGLQRIVEPGWIRLSAGPDSATQPLAARVELVGPLRVVENPVLVTPVRIREDDAH
ncbi:MAG TPA: glycoside hydrolase family 3 N-terminal domain-containing protein [Arachnia sp.]|nr:glycoside hydrolase family 3 N-terminal domain-containing protein [Arachnia sp.]HMT85600.1 glycoside hydrolase family 3 N-terminal domain-containing protein [Arachnia sp.]